MITKIALPSSKIKELEAILAEPFDPEFPWQKRERVNAFIEKYGGNFSITLWGSKLPDGVNLSNVNFSGLELVQITAKKADLSDVDLRGADLTKADFSGSNMWRTNMRRAKCFRANFSGIVAHLLDGCSSDLRGSDWKGASLPRSSFRPTIFDQKLLDREIEITDFTNLSESDFSEADLRGSDWRYTIAKNINLNDSDATYANMSNSDFGGAKVRGAILRGTSFIRSNLDGVDFTLAKDVFGMDITGATLVGSKLPLNKIREITFSSDIADLTELWHNASK